MVRRENLNISKGRKKSAYGLFFCVKFGYAFFGRLDRAAFGLAVFLLDGILTPVQSATIIVRSNGVRFKTCQKEKPMKPFASMHSRTQKNEQVIEHTPIYDLAAYEKRQKQRKQTQIHFQTLKALSTLCIFCMTFSILFLGE